MMDLDPELLHGFIVDSAKTVSECKFALTMFAANGEPDNFYEFGSKIERVTKTSQTLGLKNLWELAKLGSEIGLKSKKLEDKDQMFSVHSLLSQLLKEVERALSEIEKGRFEVSSQYEVLHARLEKANQSLDKLVIRN